MSASPTISWVVATTLPQLTHQAVHIWSIPLAFDSQFDASCLSSDEKKRADTLIIPQKRQLFIAGRCCLRNLLSTYLDIAPKAIQLTYDLHGKPSLQSNQKRLYFNVSHSNNLMLVALTLNHSIGIDIELKRPLDDMNLIARDILSDNERRVFQTKTNKHDWFFRIWTLKESYLKAIGTGLSISPDQIEFNLHAEIPEIIKTPDKQYTLSNWTFVPFRPTSESLATVAIPTSPITVSYFKT